MSFLRLFVHDAREPLLFHSGAFFLFFTAFVALYPLVRGRETGRGNTGRLLYVLGFSLFYYYKCNGVFMVALLATTVADFLLAQRLARSTSQRQRKALVAASALMGIGILGYFKYANFFLGNVASLRGASFAPLDIFLPIGISFYTFQSISYVVDVYRGDVEPCDSLLEYGFYLSFFPQIVAGPIVRASVLLPQIRRPAPVTPAAMGEGMFRIVQGLAKKALIADYVGMYSDLVFNAPGTYGGVEVLLAVYGYALQIYFDFSGYSDMAIGMALLLGFRLPENFHAPYRATSITEFWRRWHISLSTWLRDYLYIPLGGNRLGPVRQYVNLFVTMLLGGLWHGASWTFVVWGGLHGAGLALHKLVSSRWPTTDASMLRRAVGWLLTLHFVMALWVFFRAASFGDAWMVFERLTVDWQWARTLEVFRVRRVLLLTMAAGFFVCLAPTGWRPRLEKKFVHAPLLAKAVVFLLVSQAVVQVQSSDVRPFIYFQF
jgi:D-alanyl-lipoteichoic acid acyltransferase DltB (MBOAT superfamily)